MNFPSTFTARKLVNFAAEGPQGCTALFAVSTRAFPYLTDHGFQGMLVLPGTFYVEMALCVHTECLHATAARVKNVEFLNPVILSEQEFMIVAKAKPLGDGVVQYSFHESSAKNGNAETTFARVEIESDARQSIAMPPNFDRAEYQKSASDLGDSAALYGRLLANGNQYGPAFQSLRHVWRNGSEALAQLRLPAEALKINDHLLHPVLLDGIAQLMAVFLLEQGRTFILQGLGEIQLPAELSAELWVRGQLRADETAGAGSRLGDIEVFDDAGKCRFALRGVKFTYLDNSTAADSSAAEKIPLAVAATFTAEPVENSLNFWSDYLELPTRVEFAPYNQVFQQLLTPDSQLRRNQSGANVILLNLRDWAGKDAAGALRLDQKAREHFGDLERHTLPNGIEIAHLNRHETEYVYQEIFEDLVYLRHNIQLPANATVIDIGANIGLFSLFVRSRAPQATVYSFEPSPVAFRALRANSAAYGPGLHPFNAGVTERRGTALLTFYEKSSVFSSFHSDVEEDQQAIRAVVQNMVRTELGENADSVDDYVDELMTGKMDRKEFPCEMLSVSDIIHDNRLARVDLLKIDAEKCELEILRGIAAADWARIDQIVIEVHDRTRKMVDEVVEILSGHGFHCDVEEENLLTGSGLFNVYGRRTTAAASAPQVKSASADVEGKAAEFVQALGSFARTTNAPTILCVCPPPEAHDGGSAISPQELLALEERLLDQVGSLPNVYAVGSAEIRSRYPGTEFHDAHSEKLGHIPYTPEGFAAIGSSAFRVFAGLRSAPYKVIVLDCDNTLWRGACGEEGATGVSVTPAFAALQEFMIAQAAAGMLICLCSKNSAADVWAVFDRNPGMKLAHTHLAASRINWEPKSKNLHALAAELNVGLDSLIFLDDNPVECAEVQASCPAVLTLQLPADPENFPSFLSHVWAFDHLRVTDEDRTRTQKMRENAQREQYRGEVSTLKDFIAGLQLEVTIVAPTADQLPRVAQLTQRTNQFNFTTVRRTENDLAQFFDQEAGRALAISVRDRFGDYGMVGLLLYRVAGDHYEIDTFLLSCRVLGRGVEHQVLAQLGALAVADKKAWIDLPYRATDKNQPASDFVKTLKAEQTSAQGDRTVYRFASQAIAGLRYEPAAAAVGPEITEEKSSRRPATGAGKLGAKLPLIARDLASSRQLHAAIENHRLRASGFDAAADQELPATLDGRLLGIWRRVIGNPHLGMNDNFFDAGGTSLKAVQTVAAIRRELNLQLSIVNIFERPTVRLLHEKLVPDEAAEDRADEAMERGAKRKQRMRKRE